MESLANLSPLAVAGIVFVLRILDVTIGTIRTISVVHGRIRLSMVLGFVEIVVWVTAVSQVLANLGEYPFLVVAYAGGFAAGNAAGITLERWLAVGNTAVRFIAAQGGKVAAALAKTAHVLACLDGHGPAGDCTLIYVTCPRRQLSRVITTAKAVEPDLFYVIERFAETSRLTPFTPTTGWRAVIKKK